MKMRSGPFLREARRRAGFTQTQLARRAGVTQSVVSAYERGHREPSFTTLTRLVGAAGFDVELSLAARPMLPLRRLVDEHRGELVAALGERGASNVRLFGSVARGDEGPTSDVDLLVDLEPETTLLGLAGMIADAEKILGVAVDIVPASSLKPSLAQSALADAQAL